MKKTLFSLLSASALLCSTSCSDEAVMPQLGGETTVSFGIELNENTGSRAVAEGIDELCYEVYKVTKSGNTTKTTKLEGFDVKRQFTSKLQLALVEGQTYKVVFWAQNEDAYITDAATQDLDEINVIRNGKAIEDAFTCVVEVTAAPGASCKAVLTRPFAQVNFATTAQDWDHAVAAGYVGGETSITIAKAATTFNALTGDLSGEQDIIVNATATATDFKVAGKDYKRLASALVLAPKKTENGAAGAVTNLTFTVTPTDGNAITHEVPNAPICRNYRTNVLGGLLTRQTEVTVELQDWADVDGKYGFIDGKAYVEVKTPEEFNAEFAKPNVDIVRLVDDIKLAKDVTLAVAANKTKTIDLNDKTLSATTEVSTSNREMFHVEGALTVKNGTITYEHNGQNMGWGSMTAIFDVTAGGVLNLEGVIAKNLGGSDMAFVAHLNNWGEVTLNAEDCTLESTYIPVRVFNSGHNMNNVTIKNSTLKGKYSFWVHNYTVEDFGTEAKAEAQKALLNLNIYNQGNTFSPDVNGILYGFTNSVKSDAYGITKSVSEDGTEVTLGSVVKDGLIRRGVAGAEENTTIKKAVVGEGVTTLYDRTFRRFYALETVELPNTLTTIGAAGSGVFQSCTALKNIVLPESVTVLGKGTFQECSSLESINIPAGVTRIEENCLRATGLVSVEFHAGVTYFGAQAFRECKQLKEVYINAPEFTIEANAFGVMSGALPGTTIYVANPEMKAYLESTLAYKNQFTIVAPNSASNAEELSEALKKGENVVMTQDINTVAATTAPYGNKYAFKLDGGVIDGNGHELHMECYGDDYGIMTSGGTVKNLTIKEGCRAIMIMHPQSDVILDNVKIGGDGVLYPINTGEGGAEGVNLIVTNSVLAGWTSYGLIESASFTNVEFKQGTYYNNIYGRVLKPYVNTTMTDCKFVEHMNLDLSSLTAGHKITMKNCTVNGQPVTANVFTIPTTDAQYDTELFTIDLPSWALSINDCVVFE